MRGEGSRQGCPRMGPSWEPGARVPDPQRSHQAGVQAVWLSPRLGDFGVQWFLSVISHNLVWVGPALLPGPKPGSHRTYVLILQWQFFFQNANLR